VRRAPGRDLAERVLGGPVLWLGLVALTLFALLPFVWVFLASFKTRAELYEMAKQRDLPGRSKMGRDELARKLGEK